MIQFCKFALMLFILFFLSGCSSVNAGERKNNEQDLITLMLIKDIQDHALYIRLLVHDEPELHELLLDKLAMKLFDLNHFLAETGNVKVVTLVCNASRNLHDDFEKITASCQNTDSKRICEEAYHLERLCVAKHM